ncbi:mutator type transposase [Tanacetum coccineum]
MEETFTLSLIRYKGGKVNWVDDIDSAIFLLWNSGNEAEVDVSEDEWLRESLKKLPIKSKKGQQSSRKEVGQSSRNGSGSENGSGSDSGSDSEDSDICGCRELDRGCRLLIWLSLRDPQTGVEYEGVRRKALRKVARMNKAIQGKGERVYKEDFFLGEQFATSKLVKDKVTRVSVEQRRQLSLKKNDKLRVVLLCKGLCPSCPMRTPGKKSAVGVSKHKVFRAKKMAYERVVGSYSQQYAQLRDYCMELKRRIQTTHEDEWLRESLKKLPIKSKKGQQSSRKEVGQSSRNGSGSENGSGSDSGSDSEDSDYFVDEENLIEDVDVDMAEFKRHTDPGVEWLGCKENVLEDNEVFELEEVDHEEFDSGSDSDEGKVQDKCDGPLTPSTAKIFKLIVRAAAKLKVEWNGSDLYQVTCPWGDQFVVNLSERSLIVFQFIGLTTWKEDLNKFKINPVNRPHGWKKSDVPTTIIPPKPNPQIGKPPKKRKKSAAELADEMMKSKKLTKTGKSVTCKLCKQVGHNSRGCKSKKGGGSQQAGVAGHGDAAHGSQ